MNSVYSVHQDTPLLNCFTFSTNPRPPFKEELKWIRVRTQTVQVRSYVASIVVCSSFTRVILWWWSIEACVAELSVFLSRRSLELIRTDSLLIGVGWIFMRGCFTTDPAWLTRKLGCWNLTCEMEELAAVSLVWQLRSSLSWLLLESGWLVGLDCLQESRDLFLILTVEKRRRLFG